MPVLITALVAIGIQAAALVGRRLRQTPVAQQGAVPGTQPRPVGARRPRLIGRRKAA